MFLILSYPKDNFVFLLFRDAVQFMEKWEFDGLDLDYEWPDKMEKDGFSDWVKELRKEFEGNTKKKYEVSCVFVNCHCCFGQSIFLNTGLRTHALTMS